VQRRAAIVVGSVLLIWLLITLAMVGWQAFNGWKQRDVAVRAVAVERAEARVAQESNRVEAVAERLEARQTYMESVVENQLGIDIAPESANPAESPAPAAGTARAEPDRVSQLRAVGARQEQLAIAMTAAASRRTAQAEAILQQVGIRPANIGRGNANQGGPFIPYGQAGLGIPNEPVFQRLANAIDRMATLENLVASIPSTLPTTGMDLSSGFGYRRDPFTGGGAMHSGLDFKGAHGAPILAAAAGRVSFAGWQGGYGNTVEVDHGHGIMTRYAHLSRITAQVGQAVTAGQMIGGMGSTGRSTGTHLHFEVRVGGTAVNPRRFLEANSDVLEVQARAGQRALPQRAAR
jgi:murein DD-endopeptidase MepM/ murein hydrolase activator NlpD